MFPNWFVRDMLVQERGVCRSSPNDNQIQRLKACKSATEGAKAVCLMEDACRRER